jgi:DNA modification methylase
VTDHVPGQITVDEALRTAGAGYGPAIITRGDAAALLLPDESVDLIVTSPPYFGLRSYTDGGVHYEGQVGDEATPAEYLDALLACTREWVRVLKPGGSIFVNLGDKYSQRSAMRQSSHQDGLFPDRPELAKDWKASRAAGEARMPRDNVIDPTTGAYVREKSLMLLPQRYAIRCVDELELILRAEVVWSKPNGLPESVADRVRRSHEQVFHLTKRPRYYSAVDEIRTEHVRDWTPGANGARARAGVSRTLAGLTDSAPNALGALPGSVWSIPTAPLNLPAELGVDHYAAYPPELVRRIVLGWSPRNVCTACGEGRRPVVDARRHRNGVPVTGALYGSAGRVQTATGRRHTEGTDRTLTGYACDCGDDSAPVVPGVVLDPFGGTGTTALVASVFGRVGISNDLSADYCRAARWRTTDPGERARVLGVAKPTKPVAGQLGLFGDGLG